MSKIGKKNIIIKSRVNISHYNDTLMINGPYGKISLKTDINIKIVIEKNTLAIKPLYSTKSTISLWGLIRSLIYNMVIGTKYTFIKRLIISGIGYNAKIIISNVLFLTIGYNHEILYYIPNSVKISCYKNVIVVRGISKYLVGQVSADIKALKKHNPYVKKGIKYYRELILEKYCKKNEK